MRFLVIMILILLGSCTTNKSNLQTVESVDLDRYLGKWYQYAYIPNSFQPQDGALTTAEYSLKDNGKIAVVNTSYEDWEGTRINKRAKARAWVVDPSNAKLKVSFSGLSPEIIGSSIWTKKTIVTRWLANPASNTSGSSAAARSWTQKFTKASSTGLKPKVTISPSSWKLILL